MCRWSSTRSIRQIDVWAGLAPDTEATNHDESKAHVAKLRSWHLRGVSVRSGLGIRDADFRHFRRLALLRVLGVRDLKGIEIRNRPLIDAVNDSRNKTKGRFVSYHERMAIMQGVSSERCDKHRVSLDSNGECGLCRLDAIPSKPPASPANRWAVSAFAALIVGAAAWAFASRDSSESKLPAVDPAGAPSSPQARATIPHRAVEEAEIAQAYRAIPHRRTSYAASQSKLDEADARSLAELFRWVDYGVVARVGALQRLHSHQDANEPVEELNAIATQVEALAVPPEARDAARMIVSALEEQRAALESWQTQGLPTHLQADPRVRRSSQLLRNAYGQLMSSYPEETKHNKEAFFDHLCALDFI